QAIRVARGEDQVGSLRARAPGRLEPDPRAAADDQHGLTRERRFGAHDADVASRACTATLTTYASYEATPDARTVAPISQTLVRLRSAASELDSVRTVCTAAIALIVTCSQRSLRQFRHDLLGHCVCGPRSVISWMNARASAFASRQGVPGSLPGS